MSAAVKLREDVIADELRVVARESRDSRQCRRLLALAAVAEGLSRAEAAALGGMDCQILPAWVHRFNTEGMDGLLDRKLGGRPSKLSAEQKAELAAIVEAGPDIEDGLGALASGRPDGGHRRALRGGLQRALGLAAAP